VSEATVGVTTQPSTSWRTEPRWAAILTLILVFVLIMSMPSRYREVPLWVSWVGVGCCVASMVAVSIAPASAFWHRVERFVLIGIIIICCALNIASALRLIADMLTAKHPYSGITLLATATAIWTLNVLLFAFLYWQTDRVGPRLLSEDFHFAQEEKSETTKWEPRFIDYLFLAFATSTSFTTPESSRATSHRAKLLSMLQASISMVTLFLIASRAIATLS
jgi:hypothetical protein